LSASLFNPIDVEIVVGLSSPFTVCLCVVVIVVEVATAETLAFAVAFAFGRAGAKLEMDESDSVSVCMLVRSSDRREGRTQEAETGRHKLNGMI